MTFARIGALGFGGPAGQIALMHRVLVEEKRWIDEARFLHALNFCMLPPGPEAQQLATYVGWTLHLGRGALAAGVLFVLPGFFGILALSATYALYQSTAGLDAVFFGLKAAVHAVVPEALIRVVRRALKTRAHVAIAAVAFLAIYGLGAPFPLIVLGAGVFGYAMARLRPQPEPAGPQAAPIPASARTHGWRASGRTLLAGLAIWLAPALAVFATFGPGVFSSIAVFFSKMAVVTFGGAYAALAYVAQAAVETCGWLWPSEMLDGLAMAERPRRGR